MNVGYVSAFAALSGSAIGALASLATTWMTQRFQDRAQRLAQTLGRRERLYDDFIDEASRLFGDAFTHQLEDPSKMVGLYAIRSKLMLFASPCIIAESDVVMERIAKAYQADLAGFETGEHVEGDRVDVLRGFAEACRAELSLA
ncbi:hypothetical protein QO001_001444 [Methylobacterium brachiatum]|uniref:Uncharacterized protein n=1 Tax=Methylobacterium brachiatum TaxID=269660 RepID=A0AAJ1TQ15_9HYPH|nr:hypothetical protein [Methylobacterium brachiatum]MCB4802183.1 hypothetical protein [Methylobacterium brachiatum]MDQ0542526.1 hypothetical protein [Methylobacterium brachiatum]